MQIDADADSDETESESEVKREGQTGKGMGSGQRERKCRELLMIINAQRKSHRRDGRWEITVSQRTKKQ